FNKDIITGAGANPMDLFLNGLLGFVLGFKILGIAFNYDVFSSQPQAYILSSEGNIIGGTLGAALLAYLKYRDKEKQKTTTPKKEIIKVHPHELTGDITLVAAIGGIL